MSALNLPTITRDILRTRGMADGIKMLSSRESEFRTMTRKSESDFTLTGLCLIPESRDMLDKRIGDQWRTRFGYPQNSDFNPYREMIIGSGPHAAIYAATRVQMGYPRPLVIEKTDRPGGSFAITRNPSWFLNSANRPGLVGTPGNGQALNYLPGCPVQPSDLSALEYGTNADIAIATRIALAKYADVLPGVEVTSWDPYGSIPRVSTSIGSLYANRIILATGLGDPSVRANMPTDRILTFPEWLARFDRPWPLRDLSRVAVIGDGDSARVTVESLLGIGPGNMGLASLDYVPSVTWFGPTVPTNCEAYREISRTRYLRISKYIGSPRLTVRQNRGYAVPAMGSVIVNDENFDLAILCQGNTRSELYTDYEWGTYYSPSTGSRIPLGNRISGSSRAFAIGPVCNLSLSDAEYGLGIERRQENRTAIFRYANKTSALAMSLGDA